MDQFHLAASPDRPPSLSKLVWVSLRLPPDDVDAKTSRGCEAKATARENIAEANTTNPNHRNRLQTRSITGTARIDADNLHIDPSPPDHPIRSVITPDPNRASLQNG
jgi:hypothetical protein